MKNILITGSTRGIGKQIGIDLLDKEYWVYFNGRSLESVKKLDEELHEHPYYNNNCNIIMQDLSTLEGNYNLVDYFKNSENHLDCIILNLGITNRTPFKELSYESWLKVIDVNLNFPVILVKSLVDHIKDNGKIIFIGSISGSFPDSVSVSYGVSKGSLEILVKYLAKEFAPRGITVNCVAPGYVDTDWHESKSPEQIERIKNKILLKRFATTKEVSRACQILLENNYITGQTIHVDGGMGLI